jgi:(p)ppGpp synthase/HD superfamily hydrolase
MRLTERYDDALRFAADLHRDQRRKGGAIPYLSHLLATSTLVMEHGGDEDQAIAALLHDAIEDQGHHHVGGVAALRSAIRQRFGGAVLNIVDACTDADCHPKPPWRQRKEAYIAHLAEAPLPVLRVSCADKLHNARCILADYRQLGGALWERFNADRQQVLWYYRALTDAFRRAGAPAGLVDELDHAVSEIERLCRQDSP